MNYLQEVQVFSRIPISPLSNSQYSSAITVQTE